jgi:hypothetical protein
MTILSPFPAQGSASRSPTRERPAKWSGQLHVDLTLVEVLAELIDRILATVPQAACQPVVTIACKLAADAE